MNNITRTVHGLRNSYGGGMGAPIDASIAEVIERLNYLGFTTTYCCSGLDEDHTVEHWKTAYISFDRNPVGLLKRLEAAGFGRGSSGFNDNAFYMRPTRVPEDREEREYISNAECKRLWEVLRQSINQ